VEQGILFTKNQEHTLFTTETLLVAHEGKSGSFVRWLAELGIGDFLKRYPLSQLIEWGWVVPQYRIVFPEEFFLIWTNYPESHWEPTANVKQYARLWDGVWFIEDEDDPNWFLDPLFRSNDDDCKLLRQYKYTAGISSTPKSIDHARGFPIAPYADYFYRWQGYALIDVIRSSDNIVPIYSTPDVVTRAQGILRIAQEINAHELNHPETILTTPKRWADRSILMTRLDHFRGFRESVFRYSSDDSDEKFARYQRGALALADHFSITHEKLADAIKFQLLVLAKEWSHSAEYVDARSFWTARAWPHLQNDIQLAMSWLIMISGKSFEDYDAEWRLPYPGHWEWLALDKALPYGVIAHQKKFITYAPKYLKSFNEIGNVPQQFNETTLPTLIQVIKKNNQRFAGFLAAFHNLHDHLGQQPFDNQGLDFRDLRPLDGYALLAIRAEGCLRKKLEVSNSLSQIPPGKQTLASYIVKLAESRGIADKVTSYFKSHQKNLTNLSSTPDDPIRPIQVIQTGFTSIENQYVQAFLCCQLARNYFAHHDYQDHELLNSEKSAFVLKGIILTVLVLLD
jgi:hypothetical protein